MSGSGRDTERMGRRSGRSAAPGSTSMPSMYAMQRRAVVPGQAGRARSDVVAVRAGDRDGAHGGDIEVRGIGLELGGDGSRRRLRPIGPDRACSRRARGGARRSCTRSPLRGAPRSSVPCAASTTTMHRSNAAAASAAWSSCAPSPAASATMMPPRRSGARRASTPRHLARRTPTRAELSGTVSGRGETPCITNDVPALASVSQFRSSPVLDAGIGSELRNRYGTLECLGC